jgi:hypothetical protein
MAIEIVRHMSKEEDQGNYAIIEVLTSASLLSPSLEKKVEKEEEGKRERNTFRIQLTAHLVRSGTSTVSKMQERLPSLRRLL